MISFRIGSFPWVLSTILAMHSHNFISNIWRKRQKMRVDVTGRQRLEPRRQAGHILPAQETAMMDGGAIAAAARLRTIALQAHYYKR